MARFFITLYHFFKRHKGLLYLSLLLWTGAMIYCASQVKFEENVTSFFPKKDKNDYTSLVFDNLKIKDKIIVMFSMRDTAAGMDIDKLASCADDYANALSEADGGKHIKHVLKGIDNNAIGNVNKFVYKNIPLFLTDEDYLRFDSLTTTQGIAASMEQSYLRLLSPIGMATKQNIMTDPIGLSANALRLLQDVQVDAQYSLAGDHIFSADGSTLLLFVTPTYGSGQTGENSLLIDLIEQLQTDFEKTYPDIKIEYFGGPSVGVYNARQIKQDTLITLSVALLIIVVFILLVFKRKVSILLMLPTVAFGALFALTVIYFTQDSISSIAIGIGSIVMGISLSYSIHMLAHQNHVTSVEQLIAELAMPLTIGSFTTVGAFFALIFTSSDLLHDFGLFASMTLVGTTLFCLIYLPHFLKGEAQIKQNDLLRLIERINAYPYERNKILLFAILLLTIACAFLSQRVSFDSDMMSLSFEPKHLKNSEEKLNGLFDADRQNIVFVSVGKDFDEATAVYARTNARLRQMQADSLIFNVASAENFFIPAAEQQQRLEKWNNYWTTEKRRRVTQAVNEAAANYHFKDNAFDFFEAWLNCRFTPCHYDDIIADGSEGNLFAQWYEATPEISMLISQVSLPAKNKETVYAAFHDDSNVVIFDRSYFTNQWVEAVNNDFNYILFVSSALIFLALLISYGRLELTLISFLPMCISWIIIVGLMGLLGIRFNIVNIILSTFIFGIGDDFSIFIMDGLQNKYARGNKLLNSHKTAIFFSAFTTVVGMGAMVFALHPALQSISLISIIGMIAVVLVAFTIEPVIFNLFIAAPTAKGYPPFTLWNMAGTIFMFLEFLIGCLLLMLLMLMLAFVPIPHSRKQFCVSFCAHKLCKLLRWSFRGKCVTEGITNETFKKPAVIIANHASFIDIPLMLSLSPRIVMVTNKWVYNSPVFGAIVRYLGFYYTGDGYEAGVKKLRRKVDDGYSVVVFPEGTRSLDGRLRRFHKGAFYLAEALNLDILPLLFYGTHKALPKQQPLQINATTLVIKTMPRIAIGNPTYGCDYRERTKLVARYYRQEYDNLCRRFDTPDNPYFYNRLVRNFIYKGPVTEWYTRIKVKMEHNYRIFDKLIPRTASITDIGCGYGYLGYMLSMYAPDRHILGIDYDEDKIAVAQNGFAKGKNLRFECADSMQYDLPASDVFVLNDMLHYMNPVEQELLLTRCASLLNDKGMIIVRDGNASDKKHGVTRLTEIFSTRIFRFNKTVESLCFITHDQMQAIADRCGLLMETYKNDRYTSNTIYILKRCASTMLS